MLAVSIQLMWKPHRNYEQNKIGYKNNRMKKIKQSLHDQTNNHRQQIPTVAKNEYLKIKLYACKSMSWINV